jgi:uncharacterized protein YpuA (DUF1002 family)
MMQDEIIQNIFNEVETRIRNQHTAVTFNLIKQIMFDVLNDFKYVIVPSQVNAIMNSIDDFQRVISQNVSINLDESEIFGEQLLNQLSSEGWIIIPPFK